MRALGIGRSSGSGIGFGGSSFFFFRNELFYVWDSVRGKSWAWLGLILIFWWPRLRIVACRSTW